MKYYCTLSDNRYILQGLAMYNSLRTHCREDFMLYYLCLDNDIYNKLKSLNLKYLYPEYIGDLEQKDPYLIETKQKVDKAHYCWGLSSYYCYYLMGKKEIDHILYIDSDIFFYADPKLVFDEIGDKSCGIIKHRHNIVGNIDGAYNVGIIYFKNDKNGNDICNWWREGVWYNKYPEYGTCGDQKYLEGFIPNFGEENVCVIDNIGHGAPWNFRLYVYDIYPQTGNIIWGNQVQKLVFNHFSRIRIRDINKNWPQDIVDFTGGNYPEHTIGFQIFNLPVVYSFYTMYVATLREINKVLLK